MSFFPGLWQRASAQASLLISVGVQDRTVGTEGYSCYPVQCTVCYICYTHGAVYVIFIHYTVYSMLYIWYSILYTWCSVNYVIFIHYTLYCVLYVIYKVQYMVLVQHVIYKVQCTVCYICTW